MMVLFVVIVMFSACEKKEPVLNHPLSADIVYSTDGLQAAFTALTHSAVSWSWDFGDGTTSTEKDPVHVYGESGYYLVTLTATDASGKSVSEDRKSTRLNSSHVAISYAVFCLKKKKKPTTTRGII